MWRKFQTVWRGAFAVALMALLAACGPMSPTRATQSPQSDGAAAIITRSASADSPAGSDHHLSASASCLPGEQMLAGGYALENVFESDYQMLSSYPATNETWRVDTDSGSSYQLHVFAYCLARSPALGIRALQASACPAGMTRVSQGFQGAGTPYALCAARGVTLTAHGIRVGDLELDCANQATGNDQSETRAFSSTCAMVRAVP